MLHSGSRRLEYRAGLNRKGGDRGVGHCHSRWRWNAAEFWYCCIHTQLCNYAAAVCSLCPYSGLALLVKSSFDHGRLCLGRVSQQALGVSPRNPTRGCWYRHGGFSGGLVAGACGLQSDY